MTSAARQPNRRSWALTGLGILALAAGSVLSSGCNKAPAQAEAKTPEVIVTTPVSGEVTDYQDFTGRLSAVYSMDMKARVTGYLLTARFKDGAIIKPGELLFEIDSSTFQAQLAQAEANITLFDARVKRLESDYRRISSTVNLGASTQQELDQNRGDLGEAKGNLKAAIATRDLAKVNLGYCKVYAPKDFKDSNGKEVKDFTLRISRRYVDPGNLVNENMTMLTTIVSEDPMYAYFDVDERTYLDLVQTSTSDPESRLKNLNLPVLMRLSNEEEYKRHGVINFVDNQIVASTGTIRMRGEFKNPDGLLRQGLFVRVRLPIGLPYRTLLIPDEALQSDQGKKYVFVVNDKNEVVYRLLELGQEIQKMRVVKHGLAPNERVIVSGQQRVRQGVKVTTKVQEPSKAPVSPLSQLLTSLSPPAPDREDRRRPNPRVEQPAD